MEYILVTKENLEKEHICCAISNNNDIQVSSKKNYEIKSIDFVDMFPRTYHVETVCLLTRK